MGRVRCVFRGGAFLALAGIAAGQPLTGTAPLTIEADLADTLMDGAHRFVERKIAESPAGRARFWKRDFASPEAYEASVEPNRARLRKYIGAVDDRVEAAVERFGVDEDTPLVAETPWYRVWQVRWAVLEGVHGEGLWLEPKQPPNGHAVVVPDADRAPEELAGLRGEEPGVAAWLAANGVEVLVPALVDRASTWSGDPLIGMTELPHREWIYRQAYQMGRHVIGYEVQKILSAVEWLEQRRSPETRMGVAGYGEGGLLALYAAALEPRIGAALVSGYFDAREQVWTEPIYRNVWGLLTEFGDAELAALGAPRGLVVEYARAPEWQSDKGEIRTPAFASVQTEFDRIGKLLPAGFQERKLVARPGGGLTGPWSEEALRAWCGMLGVELSRRPPQPDEVTDQRGPHLLTKRSQRQVKELEDHVQRLVRRSEHTRDRYFPFKIMPELAERKWSTELRHLEHSAEVFAEGARPYREYLKTEVLGWFDDPLLPPNARTRQIYDRPGWRGYDVVLDVWPEVIAWGVLLVPKDLRPGEKRPVVVCQHGRRGVPREVIEGDVAAYRNFAARLADRGFVVFAPHNLYRGEDRYRWLDRKANGVKASMFTFILAQHQQILNWLKGLDFVDGSRIGFYGLSYGGETAVRVPTILEDYALSICSGDFNNWTRKVAATDQPFSFMYTIEWEMPYFDMGQTFDYAELGYLMVPRPFMVERGHNDRVGRDQWVAHEYAKLRWLYTQLGIGDRTEIEYFNGGHTINGEGTFGFLHKHLAWPEPGAGRAR